MNKRLPNFILQKAMFAGAVLLLALGGWVSAYPATAALQLENENTSAQQQTKITVSGTVSDAEGPVIGANVQEKGNPGNGAITDMDGNFTLSLAPDATFTVTYIGYVTQEIAVNGKTAFRITLIQSANALDEVVVVGYGTQKKVNLTGSVISVDMAKLTESRPIVNAAQAMYGIAPGVYVNSANNRPSNGGDATILVRGQGTMNNSSPLIIIDGSEGSISSVNPQDIATISILKDAASAAIYGSRAANGVILITTKKGEGGSKIEYNGYMSFESIRRPYEIVSNYADYMTYINEGNFASTGRNIFSDNVIQLWRSHENDANQLAYPNSNIFDVYETGVAHNHNLSASGSAGKISYFTSFNYYDNPGVLMNTGYDRYSLRSNLDAQVKDWLKLGTNINGYIGKASIISDAINDAYTYGLAIGNPGIAYKDDLGRLGINANGEDDPQNAANNPYNRLMNSVGDIKTYELKTRIYGILSPFKGFTLQGSYSYGYYNQTKWRKPVFVQMWNFQTDQAYNVDNGTMVTNIMNRDEKRFRYTGDVVANYQTSLLNDRLDLSIMAGASQEQFRYQFFEVTKQETIDQSLSVLDGAMGASSSSGNAVEWAMQSQFGRINLSWENKYLLEVNIRHDGSSRFRPEYRWGTFPSVSAAWRIAEEKFIQDMNISQLNNLKLRVSYGSLGNNALGNNRDLDGNYDALSTYGQSNYVLERAIVKGLTQLKIANAALRWETNTVKNIALDFTMLKNRLDGSVEMFNRYTKDILVDIPVSPTHGNASVPKQNVGEMSNTGFELALSWRDKIGKDFNYNVGMNFTSITNKVEKFKGDVPSIADDRMILEGYPYKQLYILEVDRLVQTDEDLAYVQSILNNPAVAGKTVFPYGVPKKGDLLYKDNNGDGLINDDDRVRAGNGDMPKYTFGFSVGASWKGLDFSALLQGVAGYRDIYHSALYQSVVRVGYQLNKEVIDGRWYEGRTTAATYPRLLYYTDTRNERISDFWVTNKDYLKIRNIQLGYTLPQALSKKVLMQRIRIYGSLENFFTFTKWKGYDPEIKDVTYPTMKQALFGINLTF